MAILIEGETADNVWRRAAALYVSGAAGSVNSESALSGAGSSEVSSAGRDTGPFPPAAPDAQVQGGRGGATREVLRALLTVRDPRQRWVVSREPALNPAFAIAEVVWLLAGREDAAFLNAWNPALPRYAGRGAVYAGAYGYRLRARFGLDQLERVAAALAHVPESRQAVLQIWDAATDLPDASGVPAHSDVPCNVCALLKVRAGRLEWTQVMRSNDIVLGFPHNVVQFTTVQEVLAGWIGVEPGTYGHLSDSLHVYLRDLPALAGSLAVAAGVPPRNTDVLALPKPDADRVWTSLALRLAELARADLTPAVLRSVIDAADAPAAHEHLVRVAAADIARRRHWPELATWCMAECRNPLLQHLWARWTARKDRAGTAPALPLA